MNATHREIRGEAREKRLGLIRAFGGEEEVNALGPISVARADGWCRVDSHD
jgi:hypothetical protein